MHNSATPNLIARYPGRPRIRTSATVTRYQIDKYVQHPKVRAAFFAGENIIYRLSRKLVGVSRRRWQILLFPWHQNVPREQHAGKGQGQTEYRCDD
jgi:hypothetical protein